MDKRFYINGFFVRDVLKIDGMAYGLIDIDGRERFVSLPVELLIEFDPVREGEINAAYQNEAKADID